MPDKDTPRPRRVISTGYMNEAECGVRLEVLPQLDESIIGQVAVRTQASLQGALKYRGSRVIDVKNEHGRTRLRAANMHADCKVKSDHRKELAEAARDHLRRVLSGNFNIDVVK